MSSVKVEGVDDKGRPDLIEVNTIPGKPKIKQVAFTRQRMFVLTEKGQCYVFKIVEHMPKVEDIDHFNKGSLKIKADL